MCAHPSEIAAHTLSAHAAATTESDARAGLHPIDSSASISPRRSARRSARKPATAPHAGTSGTTRARRVAHAIDPSSVAPPITQATATRSAPSANVPRAVRASHDVTITSCPFSIAFDTERFVRSILVLAVLGALGAACLDHDPGTPLGTYAVTGALGTQTCGADTQADNPWAFDVRLSRAGSILYWLQASSPPLSGTIDPKGDVTMTTTEIFTPTQADGGGPYCGVVRTDTFTAALGTDADPATFTGAIAYHYALDDGSSCGGLLAGQFDALPCDVTYSLTAKR